MIRETRTSERYFEIRLHASDVVMATVQEWDDVEQALKKLFAKHPDDEFVVHRVDIVTTETHAGAYVKDEYWKDFQ